MKKKNRKKTSLWIICLVLAVVLIFCLVVGIHCVTTTKYGQDYSIKHSQVGAQSFESFVFQQKEEAYPYSFWVSSDTDKDSEIRILAQADNGFYNALHLGGRSRDYMTAVTDKAVGSLLIDLEVTGDVGEEQSVLLYYSNNADKIAKCVYTQTLSGGVEEEVTVPVQENAPFAVLIPYILNHNNTGLEISNVRFYDSADRLVYTDAPDLPIENHT